MSLTFVIIVFITVIIVVLLCHYYHSGEQRGGEMVSYTQLEPDNSQRHQPLGSLTDEGYIPPSQITPQRHTTPSRIHSHDSVTTEGIERRKQPCDYEIYEDQFDWKPYDWRPFEWRPYWLRRKHLCPSARDCREFASDNCIGIGDSDYQSCYDAEYAKCPRSLQK
jgi:hypothetical protein